MHAAVISDERESAEERVKQNTGHELKVQNEDLQKKIEDFDISQEGRLFFLC